MISLSSFSIPIFSRGYYTQQKSPWMVPNGVTHTHGQVCFFSPQTANIYQEILPSSNQCGATWLCAKTTMTAENLSSHQHCSPTTVKLSREIKDLRSCSNKDLILRARRRIKHQGSSKESRKKRGKTKN
jgi:hypothetical protein